MQLTEHHLSPDRVAREALIHQRSDGLPVRSLRSDEVDNRKEHEALVRIRPLCSACFRHLDDLEILLSSV